MRFFKGIDDWWSESSTIEKIVVIIIGFSLGNFLDECLLKLFSIDSFLLTTTLGITSLYVTIFLAHELKKRKSST